MKERLNANAQAMFDVIQTMGTHPTASEVYELVKVTRPRIGLASVYRILHSLVEQGYLKELRHNDETCRYDARTERHDHAICTICGALIDLPIEVELPHQLLQRAASAAGIELSSHELRLYGLCPACRERKNAGLQQLQNEPGLSHDSLTRA